MPISGYTGWDIGGAHLKVACVDMAGRLRFAEQYATPLWRGLDRLQGALARALKQLPGGTLRHAVTMTGELADIFKDRQTGLNTLLALCGQHLGPNARVYTLDRGLAPLADAKENPAAAASANWHAMAAYTAQCRTSGLLIDIGSTTTDIIPIRNGRLAHRGSDDQSRLRLDELLYSGVIRTPLMALARRAPFAGEWQSLAAEHFATTADIYRITGQLDGRHDLMAAADAGAKDRAGSIQRLARMLGTDAARYPERHHWERLAAWFAERQLQFIWQAIARALSNGGQDTLIGAGAGRFLVARIAARGGLACIPFSDLCGADPALSDKCNICAPAVALARINRRHARQ